MRMVAWGGGSTEWLVKMSDIWHGMKRTRGGAGPEVVLPGAGLK